MKNLFTIVGILIITFEFIVLLFFNDGFGTIEIAISLISVVMASFPFFGIAHLAECNENLQIKIQELEDKLNSQSKNQ